MKVTVNVECSPEEARAFMGLPDVQPMQAALLAELQQRLSAGMQALDPQTIMQTWLPAGMQNAGELQKMFWNQVQQTVAGATQAASGMMASFAERKSKV